MPLYLGIDRFHKTMTIAAKLPHLPSGVADLVTRIRNELGCSKELAADYASDIGDTPEIDHQQVLIRNADRRIIARLPVNVLG